MAAPTPMRPAPGRLRKVVFRLAAPVVGAGIALLLGEGIARVRSDAGGAYGIHPRFPYRADPVSGWRHHPSESFRYRTKEFRTTFVTNDEGFRSSHSFTEHPRDSTVVALLGDSFVQAIQVSEAETFAALLEKRLGSSGVARVWNCGVSNIGLVHYLTLYRSALRAHHPDVVVITVTDQNDIRNSACKSEADGLDAHYVHDAGGAILDVGPYTFREAPRATPGHYGLIGWLGAHSALYRWLMLVRARLDQSESVLNYFPEDAFVFAKPPSAEFAEHWRHAGWCLTTLVREIRADSARPVVLLMPSRWTISDKSWSALERGFPGPGHLDRDRVRDEIGALAAASGVPFLDLTEAFLAATRSGRSPHFRVDGHLNAEGHRVTADVLGALLVAQVLYFPARGSATISSTPAGSSQER